MKAQCDVCERAEAAVFCCADEAALCAKCDTNVHDANKLASKHPRLSLNQPQQDFPRCDICQEKRAYFFCREDRALLCRDCDFSVHSANDLTAKHSRFLVFGARVSLNPAAEASSSSSSSVPIQLRDKAAASLVEQAVETNPLTDLPVFLPEKVNPTGYVSQYLKKMEEFLAFSPLDLVAMGDSSKGEDIGKAWTADWAADIGLPMEAAAALYGDSLAEVPHTPSSSASMDLGISPYSQLGFVMRPKPRQNQHHYQPQPYVCTSLNRTEDSFLVPDVGLISSNKRMRPTWNL